MKNTWNLIIHRTGFWLTALTILAGATELYLLCNQWIVAYSVVQIGLSLWLANRLGDHIYDMRVAQVKAHYDKYWEKVRAENKVNSPRVATACQHA